jgi:hypothetical protein
MKTMRAVFLLSLGLSLSAHAQTHFVADMNGDGLGDLVRLTNTQVYVQYSTGKGFEPPLYVGDIAQEHCAHESGCAAPAITVGDVDGDGRADIVTFSDGTPSVLVPRSGYKKAPRTPRKMPGTSPGS